MCSLFHVALHHAERMRLMGEKKGNPELRKSTNLVDQMGSPCSGARGISIISSEAIKRRKLFFAFFFMKYAKEPLHNPFFRFFTSTKSMSCKRKFVRKRGYAEVP